MCVNPKQRANHLTCSNAKLHQAYHYATDRYLCHTDVAEWFFVFFDIAAQQDYTRYCLSDVPHTSRQRLTKTGVKQSCVSTQHVDKGRSLAARPE